MRIETAGVSNKKTGSRFSAIVKVADRQTNFVYDAGAESTLNQVELLAIKFALLGIDPEQAATVTTASNYVSDMLKKDGQGWIRSPKTNKELIEEIRQLLEDSNVQILLEKSEAAKDLCKK